MIKIRNAIPTDAKTLAQLAESTFRDTFTEQNTEVDMNEHCLSTYGEDIQLQEISDPVFHTIVAEEVDQMIGYAQLRWGEKPDCISSNSAGEIQRLYIKRAFHGTGLANELMSICLSVLRERGSDIAWLGVWEENPRAIAFYKKNGFKEVGSHVFVVGSDPQRDIILECEL